MQSLVSPIGTVFPIGNTILIGEFPWETQADTVQGVGREGGGGFQSRGERVEDKILLILSFSEVKNKEFDPVPRKTE